MREVTISDANVQARLTGPLARAIARDGVLSAVMQTKMAMLSFSPSIYLHQCCSPVCLEGHGAADGTLVEDRVAVLARCPVHSLKMNR